MKDYNKYLPKLSEEQKKEQRDQLSRIIKLDLNPNSPERSNLETEYNRWQLQGINYLDVLSVGPFSAREWLTFLGVDCSTLEPVDQLNYIEALEQSEATLKVELSFDKQNESYHTSESLDAKKERMASINHLEKYTLTSWDKFCAFFGIKTEHALTVEANRAMHNATLESYRERQEELNKSVKAFNAKSLREIFINDHQQVYERGNNLVKDIRSHVNAWEKVFFGQKKLPDYVFDNGVKVSSLSICMAAIQQKYHVDFSSMTPEQVAADTKLKEGIDQVVERFRPIVNRKLAAMKKDPRFQYLDNFLFTPTADTKKMDDAVKGILKTKEPVKYQINTQLSDAERMGTNAKQHIDKYCAKAYVFIKTKNDMLKIFGKDDSVYSMTNDKGEPEKPLIVKREEYIRRTLDGIKTYEAIVKEDYDTMFDLNKNFNNDYNKLEDCITQCYTKMANIDETVRAIKKNGNQQEYQEEMDANNQYPEGWDKNWTQETYEYEGMEYNNPEDDLMEK